MVRKKGLIFRIGLLLLTLVIAIAVAGCPANNNGEDPQTDGQDQQQNQGQNQAQADLNVEALVSEWSASGHATKIESPGARDNCVLCHDGYAYAEQIEEVANIPEGKKVVGPEDTMATITTTDCQACHTGAGAEQIQSGSVDGLPFMDEAYTNAGSGAVCMFCHSGRRNPADIVATVEGGEEPEQYPHYGPATALFTGEGGMELADGNYESSKAHQGIDNTCVGCHMPAAEEGHSQHTFTMDEANVGQTCGGCHDGAENFDVRGAQSEVQAMLDQVSAAFEEATGVAAGDVATGQGGFDWEGSGIDEVSTEAYVAIYNWKLISYDGSLGVHNPKYAKSLLRESYRLLTGEELQVE